MLLDNYNSPISEDEDILQLPQHRLQRHFVCLLIPETSTWDQIWQRISETPGPFWCTTEKHVE